MSKVLVVGSINIDKTTILHHLPQIGETILGDNVTESCGGKGANQAYAAAKLGAEVTMLGAVGNDAEGQKALDNMKSVGINVEHIYISDKPTGIATILVTRQGENMIIVIPGSNMDCSVDYLKSHVDLIKQADIILMQFEIPMESIEFVIDNKGDNTIIVLDPAPYNDYFTFQDLEDVDILTPNETELQHLTGKNLQDNEEWKAVVEELMTYGPKHSIVTLGGKGGYHIHKNGYELFQSVPVQAVDSTAAGDTFNGALASRISKGYDLNEAIHWANHAAAISVTRMGAQDSIPSEQEVEEFIEARLSI